MIRVGYNSYVNEAMISAVSCLCAKNTNITYEPLKRLIISAYKNSLLIDYCFGDKAKSAIILKSGQIILSDVNPATILLRMNELVKRGF